MEKDFARILDYIKGQLTGSNFKAWFGQTKLGEITDTKLILKVPSAFVKGQLIKRYEGLIKEASQQILQKNIEIEYQIDSSLFPKKTTSLEEDIFDLPSFTKGPSPISTLNPKYTLENFVVGPTNNLAYAAAGAVVQNPGSSYNPLFIYGQSGVGKTHLMQAIGNALLRKSPNKKLVFVSSEKFMNDHIESIQNKKTGEFRSRYRSAQVLLMDDIQFLGGKDSTQEEFFHTFNELHSRDTQIVLTSDRLPQDIEKLEDRLRSRFQGGLMVDIQIPDFETRVAILKTKLSERGESLPEELLHLIAEGAPSNARELEGKLIQILQAIKLGGMNESAETVRSLLNNQPDKGKAPLSQKKVLEGVNSYFRIKMSDLLGPRRQKELVLPRQIAMYILYTECKIPMEKVGQILGGRDHTTILHGVKKIENSISRDREIQRLLIEVKQSLI